jgi:hypothetical protein
VSVDGPVSYIQGDWEVEAERKEEPEWRKLDARKYRTQLCTIISNSEGQVSDFNELVLQGGLFELSLGEPCSSNESSPSLFYTGVGEMIFRSWRFHKDVSELEVNTPFWFLPLVFINPKWTARIDLSGLGLVEVADKPGTYERIGHVYGEFTEVPSRYRKILRKPHLQRLTLI